MRIPSRKTYWQAEIGRALQSGLGERHYLRYVADGTLGSPRGGH